MTTKMRFAGAAAALVALGACVNTAGERTQTGALIGGSLGALAGLSQGDDQNDRLRNAAIGGVAGAAIGGGIGAILDRQAAELQGSLSNQIQVVNQGDRLLVRMPQDILFAVDSATVQPALRSDLITLAGSLNRYPNSRVQIVGHTDNTGAAAYNKQLSIDRARSVRSILIGSGVSAGRIGASGAGEDQPIATNQTVAGRALNRRVDIFIIPNQ